MKDETGAPCNPLACMDEEFSHRKGARSTYFNALRVPYLIGLWPLAQVKHISEAQDD